MNGLFKINWTNVKSAITYGLLTLLSIIALAVVQAVFNAGTVFGLDWKAIVDSSVIATLPSLIVALSVIKNFFTNRKGEFLGITEVVSDKQ